MSRWWVAALGTVLALGSAELALAKKAAKGTKAEKECVQKGGTWSKKKKTCALPKDAKETPAPKSPPPPPAEEPPADGEDG